MNVLELVNAAAYEVGVTPPTTLLSTTAAVSLQWNAYLKAVSRSLRNKRIFPQQKRVHNFTLEAGRGKYPLPQDFHSAILDTQWDKDTSRRMIGPLSDGNWNYHLYGVGGNVADVMYRIFGPDSNPNTLGGQFQILPVPTVSGKELTFEYRTKTMFLPPNWRPNTSYDNSNPDYVNANGNIYVCVTSGTSGTTPPDGTGAGIIDGTAVWDFVAAPYEQPLTDFDLSLYDDDIMIAGLRGRYQLSKGLVYEEAMFEFESLVNNAQTRFNGSFVVDWGGRIGSRYEVPWGGWGI